MAAGKAVIGVAESGLLETVHDQQTGLLIPLELSFAALIDTVMRMTPAYVQAMREACEQHRLEGRFFAPGCDPCWDPSMIS
jgi:hypothetical protein